MTTVVEPDRDDAPDEPGAHTTKRSSWPRRLVTAAPVYTPALIVAVGGWQHRWMDEDAFINLRIVDQIFAGHGPVFNAGERVESATSTLWLVVLVVARAIFGSFASMEFITMLASLVTAVAAFALAGAATRRLHRDDPGTVVPVGLLLVAGVAVVWDFSTSGLEMGLVWLWIAASWYVLVGAAQRAPGDAPHRWRRAGALVVIGIAPLVRPDLALMTICFLVAWFVLVQPRHVVLDLGAALALPVAYQVFRMGYYAAVVPTTALAKDASGIHFGQGWRYVTNFADAYLLWITALLVAGTIVLRMRARPDRRMATVTIAILAAAALHAFYITAIGGDYMHARLLLPAFFAGALPASIAVPRVTPAWRNAAIPAVAGLATVWAIVSIVAFRPPPNPKSYLLSPISDFRTVSGAKLHPTDTQFGLSGYEAAAAYARGVRGYFKLTDKQPRPGADPNAFVLTLGSIGVPAYDAGRHIWVVDIGGLAEPLAARTAPVPGRAAGHRKQIDDAWYDARFGSPSFHDAKVDAARQALTCGPLPGLLRAVDGKLTAGRFVSNFFHSFGYTRIRVPSDPVVAAQEWCRPAG